MVELMGLRLLLWGSPGGGCWPSRELRFCRIPRELGAPLWEHRVAVRERGRGPTDHPSHPPPF